MAAADWDEVKRLAADFRRAQLISTSQTLSERNCIEIITKLIELNLLDVIFTTDGKEYITPQYLLKEIKDELYVSGGRLNLVELSKTLNVDLSHITSRIPEIERSSTGCTLIMGQLINKTYQKTIAYEINEKLQRLGQINVGDLTKVYDLPGDFLQDIVEKNLGKLILGKQDKSDSRIFYTDAFIEKNKCLVRGALRAFTKPVQVSVILQITQLESRDFYFAFDSLLDCKEVCGSLTARQAGNAMFIPYIYTKQINEWVDNFYAQNGYLEFDALVRIGISEPKAFIRRHFPSSGMHELSTCVIGPQLLSQVESAVEEALRTGTYVDILMLVPSVFSPADIKAVLNEVLKKNKNPPAHIFCDTVFVTEPFLQELSKLHFVTNFLQNKAELAVSSGAYMNAQTEKKLGRSLTSGSTKDEQSNKAEKRDERRRKAAGGKSGGGTQGRETKTKAVKKKGIYGNRNDQTAADSDSDHDMTSKKEVFGKLEIISKTEVEELLNNVESDIADIDGIIPAIAEHLQPALNKEAIRLASIAYERTLVSSIGDRRKAHVDLQDKVDMWMMELRLSDRGLKLFPDKDDQMKLASYVIKSTGLLLVNAIFTYATQDNPSTSIPADKEFTAEMRTKLLPELSAEVREPLTKLNKCLTGTSIDEFLAALDPALTIVGLLNRKVDKKKEKQFIQTRRELLLSQLAEADNPATVLLIGLLLIFQVATQNVLNASGKFVPLILLFLKPYLTTDIYQTLLKFQDLVVQLWTVGDNEELETKLKSELNELMPQIKDLCSDFRKSLPEKGMATGGNAGGNPTSKN